MPRVTKNEKSEIELLETSVNTGRQSYYHITKSFNVASSRSKHHPLSEAAALLNHIRMKKGALWGSAALISLSSVLVILLI